MEELQTASFNEEAISPLWNALESKIRSKLQTMNAKNLDSEDFDEEAFLSLYKRFIDKRQRESMKWSEIKHVGSYHLKDYDGLTKPTEEQIKEALSQLVVVKLNGGLGTSMECEGPKSLIPVCGEQSFLDLSLQHIESLNKKYKATVPFVLMNSFNTELETDIYLKKKPSIHTKIFTFKQNRFPRISADTCEPLATSINLKELHDPDWYPPGHGDIYRGFESSGLLSKFLDEGKTWMFLSNIDNLGATPDPKILCWLINQEWTRDAQRVEFLMEVCQKTTADRKGGTLICYKNGLRLLEVAQVPDDHMDDFLDPKQFCIFNTNSLWINLKALMAHLTAGTLQMDLIVNRKTLKSGKRVIQLEEAAGAAIMSFKNAIGLKVPRSRFLPVKMTSDLLLLKSDLFVLQNGVLTLSPQRVPSQLPTIELDSHFKGIHDFETRIPDTPSLIGLNHLTLSGDIYFGKNVVLKYTYAPKMYNAILITSGSSSSHPMRNLEIFGTQICFLLQGNVKIIAHANARINIPDGTLIEDKEMVEGIDSRKN